MEETVEEREHRLEVANKVGEANLAFFSCFSCCLMNEVDHVSFFYLCLVMKPFENLAMRFLLHGFMCAWSFHSFFWLCALGFI